MTIHNVHIYRKMRLVFGGIEADSPEAAAAVARDKPTEEADSIDDCEGETFAALVDVAGDGEYEHSQLIEFESEQVRRTASRLLVALASLADQSDEDCPIECRSRHFTEALADARDAIGAASGQMPSDGKNRTLTIEVEGGLVQDVANLPPGWDYEVNDHDNAG